MKGAHRLRRVPREAPDGRAAPLTDSAARSRRCTIEASKPWSRWPDGTLLAIAEGVRTPGGDLAAWLIEDDPHRPSRLCVGRRLCADRRGSPGRHHLCPRAAVLPARRSRGARRRAGCGGGQARRPSGRPRARRPAPAGGQRELRGHRGAPRARWRGAALPAGGRQLHRAAAQPDPAVLGASHAR